MSLYEVQNLSFQYSSHSSFELKKINLTLQTGGLVGLLGANGAGKSTLLKLMAGLLVSHDGQVLFNGKPLGDFLVRDRAKKIAYVPQSTHFTFPLEVMEIVEMGRHPYLGRFETLRPKDREICERALTLCDAVQFKDRSYEELSGGEKQRVLLASALAQTPEVLLLDEPTLSLDLPHQVLLFEIVQKLHREEKVAVVVATHDLNLAGRFLDRIVLMKDGKIFKEGIAKKILNPKTIQTALGMAVDQLPHGSFPVFVPKQKKKGKS